MSSGELRDARIGITTHTRSSEYDVFRDIQVEMECSKKSVAIWIPTEYFLWDTLAVGSLNDVQ